VADFGNGRPPQVITDRHRAAAADPDAAHRATVGTLPGPDLCAGTPLSLARGMRGGWIPPASGGEDGSPG
jgi:hypothetical protein